MNRSYRIEDNNSNSFIPSYSGTNGAVATHSNLSSMTAYNILNQDRGNAFDAAAGAMLVEGLVNPQMFGMGGEGVMILKPKNQNPVVLNGNTLSPRKFNFLNLVTRGFTEVPDEGVLCAGVPAAFSSIFRMLQLYGTLDFRTISKYAKEYAKEGYPLHTGIINQNKFGLKSLKGKFIREWKNSAKLYLKNNKIPKVGSLFRNSAYANLIDYLGNYEKKITGSRNNKFNKLHDAFYKGDVANSILKYSQKNEGLLSKEDFENFNVKFEKTISEKYGDYQVHKTNFWGQGLTSLMMLKMLNKQKIKSLNSAGDIHKFTEILKLTFADREMYFTGKYNSKVKANHLLDDSYLNKRMQLIKDKAIDSIIPGNPLSKKSLLPIENDIKPWGAGTVHISIIDKDNNAISCTPSGGWIRSNEVINELGFPLGNRLMTFYLSKPGHVNFIAPVQQPRTTLSPTLIINQKKREILSCGTMGGDAQDQWQAQFLMNYIFSNMPIDQALNEPRVSSEHLPAFFHPHDPNLKQLLLEERLSPFISQLNKKGHKCLKTTDWSEGFILCARKQDKIYDAYADIRSYKSQIFQAQALAW
jgi:gamma-glutamyltranspeptidase/glutathione hydrolase|tara:strand:- start:974 stop:2725 length:1752 start_codon:yes stop_codon:yes gene_type:complete